MKKILFALCASVVFITSCSTSVDEMLEDTNKYEVVKSDVSEAKGMNFELVENDYFSLTNPTVTENNHKETTEIWIYGGYKHNAVLDEEDRTNETYSVIITLDNDSSFIKSCVKQSESKGNYSAKVIVGITNKIKEFTVTLISDKTKDIICNKLVQRGSNKYIEKFSDATYISNIMDTTYTYEGSKKITNITKKPLKIKLLTYNSAHSTDPYKIAILKGDEAIYNTTCRCAQYVWGKDYYTLYNCYNGSYNIYIDIKLYLNNNNSRCLYLSKISAYEPENTNYAYYNENSYLDGEYIHEDDLENEEDPTTGIHQVTL